MKTVGFVTLGCKVNQYESEAIAEECARLGLSVADSSGACDVYIINTCTVTAEADRKSCQMIRQCRRRNPSAFIIVCGCSAQHDRDRIAAIEGVNAVIGNTGKLECARLAYEFTAGLRDGTQVISVKPLENAPFEEMKISSFPRTRQYIKIEDGCENRCTYCAISHARGPVRSKAPDDVLSEAMAFVRAGSREIVLTGIETASYGKDNGCSLEDLLCRLDVLLEGHDVAVRLGSVDPTLFRHGFVSKVAALKSPAHHFHISMQSGSSRILAAMKRPYNAAQALEAFGEIRAAMPDVMFTTDMIVGFPGETEEDFLKTVEFVKQARFLKVHVFPFSARKGTEAALMPGKITKEEKHRRVLELSAAEAEVRKELLEAGLGKIYPALFESCDNGIWTAHTRNFIEVHVLSDLDLHGKIYNVKLTQTAGEYCLGELAGKDET